MYGWIIYCKKTQKWHCLLFKKLQYHKCPQGETGSKVLNCDTQSRTVSLLFSAKLCNISLSVRHVDKTGSLSLNCFYNYLTALVGDYQDYNESRCRFYDIFADDSPDFSSVTISIFSALLTSGLIGFKYTFMVPTPWSQQLHWLVRFQTFLKRQIGKRQELTPVFLSNLRMHKHVNKFFTSARPHALVPRLILHLKHFLFNFSEKLISYREKPYFYCSLKDRRSERVLALTMVLMILEVKKKKRKERNLIDGAAFKPTGYNSQPRVNARNWKHFSRLCRK